MSNRKLILLNGGIGCGKTELTTYLHSRGMFVNKRCKDKLHELTMAFFCVQEKDYWEIYNNRDLKEQSSQLFSISLEEFRKLSEYLGSMDDYNLITETFHPLPEKVWLSIREAMIYVSEILCKPAFGQDYFGKARVKDISDGTIAIDDSVGFEEELYPAIEELGQDNILMIRIKGRGTFEGDSRSFIKDGIITNTIDVYNTGTLEGFFKECEGVVFNFLDKQGRGV